MVNDGIAGGGIGQRLSERATLGEAAYPVADQAAGGDRGTRGGGLDRPPDAQRQTNLPLARGRHGGGQRTMTEQAGTEPDQARADSEQRQRLQRCGENHGAEGQQANQGAKAGQAIRVRALSQQAGGEAKAA